MTGRPWRISLLRSSTPPLMDEGLQPGLARQVTQPPGPPTFRRRSGVTRVQRRDGDRARPEGQHHGQRRRPAIAGAPLPDQGDPRHHDPPRVGGDLWRAVTCAEPA